MYDCEQKVYCVTLGGKKVRYTFLYPGTVKLFKEYIAEENNQISDIQLTEEYISKNKWLVQKKASNEYLEFQCAMLAAGNYLLGFKRALFHGVSFIWKEKAWIITAPSGTGKTTQLLNWLRMYKDEIELINGDKPVLEWRTDNTIWVSSSPWKGKEKFGSYGKEAQLGGIILLEQGADNKISVMSRKDAAFPLYLEFVSYPETTKQIRNQGELLNHILETVPVWNLVNIGDHDSTKLTKDTMEKYLEKQK